MNKLSIDTLVKRFETIKSNRSTVESLWQECANYCMPHNNNITKKRTPGTKIDAEIYDSTAITSVAIMAAGFHNYLTNPASKWFSLSMKNKELNEDYDTRQWLKKCEDRIYDALNNSNFNEVIPEWYVDFGTLGNSCLYEEEDVEDDVVFFVRPMSEIYILINDKGKIDSVYRSFYFTARQAYQRWGENAGSKVKEALEAGKVEEKINFLHIVLPREERNVKKKDARNMPFASLYIEPTNKKILSEGGYEEFPFFIPRFYKVSDSEYAYSPASMCLADIKMINAMSKANVEAAEKKLNPPIVLPHDGFLLPFKTSAKAINYRLTGNADDKVDVLDITGDIGISLEMENQRRQKIERAFYVDLFLMLATLPDKNRTATEIIERVNERMAVLGPALGRLMKTLSGIIDRTFAILMRNGKLPLPPEKAQGQEYKIEYVSPLAKAQRASETKSLTDLLLFAQSIAQFDPSVIDNIDLDKVVKKVADVTFTTDVLKSDDDIKKIRAARQEQMAMQNSLEQLKLGGEGAAKIAEAEERITGGANAGKPAGQSA